VPEGPKNREKHVLRHRRPTLKAANFRSNLEVSYPN